MPGLMATCSNAYFHFLAFPSLANGDLFTIKGIELPFVIHSLQSMDQVSVAAGAGRLRVGQGTETGSIAPWHSHR